MNASATRLLVAVGLFVVVAAAVWWLAREAAAAPAGLPVAADASQRLTWRTGTRQQYRLVLDSQVQLGGGPAEPGEPIHQEVHGVLSFTTLAVAVDQVVVGMQFGPVTLRVGGAEDAEVARGLAAPFRVTFDPAGMPVAFAFPAEVPSRQRQLLEELVRTFQVVVRDGAAWQTDEAHATGRYEARYERTAAGLQRQKLRYLASADAGAPAVAVRQALATVRLAAPADWLASMVVDETLAAHDASGLHFEVTTRGQLDLLPSPSPDGPAAVDGSFVATAGETAARDATPVGALPADELAASLASLLAALDSAAEGRTVWVHRLRDLLRADPRVAALLLARLQAEPFTDRTRADLFLALELGATPEAQAGLVQVAQGSTWALRDRARALVALGGLAEPMPATVDALWATARTRADALQGELANTALLALGAIGSRLPHTDDALYGTLRNGLLAEAWGAAATGERAVALLALANTGDRTLGEQLTPFLDDTASEVRRAAAKAVGRLGGEPAVAELALRFPAEPNSAVRAAMAAGCAASPVPAPEVLAMARTCVGKEPDETARLELARCLGRHLAAHPDNEPALRAMFATESSPTIRRYVGEVLGRAAAAAEPRR